MGTASLKSYLNCSIFFFFLLYSSTGFFLSRKLNKGEKKQERLFILSGKLRKNLNQMSGKWDEKRMRVDALVVNMVSG